MKEKENRKKKERKTRKNEERNKEKKEKINQNARYTNLPWHTRHMKPFR